MKTTNIIAHLLLFNHLACSRKEPFLVALKCESPLKIQKVFIHSCFHLYSFMSYHYLYVDKLIFFLN